MSLGDVGLEPDSQLIALEGRMIAECPVLETLATCRIFVRGDGKLVYISEAGVERCDFEIRETGLEMREYLNKINASNAFRTL